MVRPKTLRRIGQKPSVTYYKPQGIPLKNLAEVVLSVEGFEALRLVDFNGFDQAKAAEKMGISKATFCRILSEAHKIVATALTQGHALRITGGDHFFEEENTQAENINCLPKSEVKPKS